MGNVKNSQKVGKTFYLGLNFAFIRAISKEGAVSSTKVAELEFLLLREIRESGTCKAGFALVNVDTS